MIQAHAVPRPKEDYKRGPTVSRPTDHNPTTWLHPYQSHQGPVRVGQAPKKNGSLGVAKKVATTTKSFSTNILIDMSILHRYPEALKVGKKKRFISCIHQKYIEFRIYTFPLSARLVNVCFGKVMVLGNEFQNAFTTDLRLRFRVPQDTQ